MSDKSAIEFNNIISQINNRIEHHRLDVVFLSILLGVHQNTVRNQIKDHWKNCKASILRKLLEYLDRLDDIQRLVR